MRGRHRTNAAVPLAGCAALLYNCPRRAHRGEPSRNASDLGSFELLLVMIGVGFGPLPGLSQTALQNSVPRHQLGIAVGSMNFCRSLLGTILVSAFGAIVAAGTASIDPGALAPGALGGTLEQNAAPAAEAFRRVFFAAAGTLSVALLAIVLLEEAPLQTDVAGSR
jgi:MFS family permease